MPKNSTLLVTFTSLLSCCGICKAQAPQLIARSHFTSGLDGWTENRPSRRDVSWIATGGNPGGYAQFDDSGNGSTFLMLAPSAYLGSWSRLDGQGVLIFEQRVMRSGGQSVPHEVFLEGPGGAAHWQGALADRSGAWTTVAVSIDASQWTVTAGSWQGLLSHVTALGIRVELMHNYEERTATDNVSLWSGPSALWDNYGQGWPGRNGVPRLSLDDLPRIGTTRTVSVVNSLGAATSAVLLIGVAPLSRATAFGGTLLVDPMVLVPLALSPAQTPVRMVVPAQPRLGGAWIYLQALELDPWAARGVSFTAGLAMRLGA